MAPNIIRNVTCPVCKAKIRLDSPQSDSSMVCPKCGKKIKIEQK